MLNDHDRDVIPRCRRLGHEVDFEYCRQETAGKPCRLVFDCWWERFDVRSFLGAHLPEADMAQLEGCGSVQASQKVLTLLELIQEAKDRVASGDNGSPILPEDKPGGADQP